MSLGLKGLDKKAYDPLHTQYYAENYMNRARKFAKVCSFYGQNDKIVQLSNMADTIFEKSQGVQRTMGFFLDCVFRMLIG